MERTLEHALPNHVDDERCILTIAMVHPEQLSRVVGAFNYEDFYPPLHQKVFRALEIIEEADKTPDPLTVVATIREIEEEATTTVTDVHGIMYGVPHYHMDDKAVRQMVARLHDASDRRRTSKLLDFAKYTILDGETELADELTMLENAFDSLRVRRKKSSGFEDLADFADEMVSIYEAYHRGETSAIPTGIPELDGNLAECGFSCSDLITVAALTGRGKTTLALNIAGNMARAGNRVGYISREMTKYMIFKRLHAIEIQIKAGRIRPSIMSNRDLALLKQTIGIMRSLPISVDSSTPNVHRIRRNVRDAVRTRGMRALFVDYLQLLRASDKARDSTNRTAEVSTVSTTLKEMATDLNIPVVALSQFSRAAIGDGGKIRRPILSDLRESGQIEQDSSCVIFMHTEQPESRTPDYEIIIAKQRDYESEISFAMQFDKSYLTFTTEQVASLISTRVDAYASMDAGDAAGVYVGEGSNDGWSN